MAVEAATFTIGRVSEAAAAVLAGGTLTYAALSARYAWRGFQAHLEDRWSAALSTIVLFLLGGLLAVRGEDLVPAPFSIWLILVMLGAIAFTLTYTLGRYQERIERFREQFGERLNHLLADVLPEERYAEWLRLRATARLGHEERRKVPHLLMGIFLAFYLAIGYLVLRGFWDLAYGGAAPLGSGEGILNLYAASHGAWLAAGHMFSIFCLIGLLFVLLPTELLRLKYPELSYPFKGLILSRLRKREAGLFGAHLYLSATMPLAVLVLAWEPARWPVTLPAILAMIAVTVFADAASALVGIRYGKTKWFPNPGKSYLGSLGGVVVAFLVAWPFVGIPMALATAAVFLFVDAIAPVPIAVSDNILNPLALTALYAAGVAHLAPVIPYY